VGGPNSNEVSDSDTLCTLVQYKAPYNFTCKYAYEYRRCCHALFLHRRMSFVLVGVVWCLLLVARGEEQLMELGEFGLDSELRFKRFPQVSLHKRILTHCEQAGGRTHDSQYY
jgi:hypothetical protein